MNKLYQFNGLFKGLSVTILTAFLSFGPVQSLAFAQTENAGSSQQPATSNNGVPTSPTFQEADKNQDHYVTKDELEGYPILLEKFESVDAGNDGKLEFHEYRNLVMEKRREKY